jgi:hypothetical protein
MFICRVVTGGVLRGKEFMGGKEERKLFEGLMWEGWRGGGGEAL